LVAGQAAYTLPANMLILRSVSYKYSGMASFSSLRYVNLQELDDALNGWDGTTYSNSQPLIFSRYANTISLFPVPDQSATGGLKYLYNQIPTDIVSLSDTPVLPSIYHTTIFKYCLWQASMLDEDYDPAQLHKSIFDEDMRNLMGLESVEQSATYPTISVREEDM
jgi:hypothetical protein